MTKSNSDIIADETQNEETENLFLEDYKFSGSFFEVIVNSVKGLKRRFTFTIESDYIKDQIEVEVAASQKNFSVPGFRKGKVPLSIIKNKCEDELHQNVLQKSLNMSSQEFITQSKVQTIDEPQLSVVTTAKNENFVYALECEISPIVPSIDIKSIKLTEYTSKITAADVKSKISSMKEEYFTPVDAEDAHIAKNGDIIVIDFNGFVDGKNFDGGSAENFSLELGKGSMIPGFEDQLIGTQKGTKKTLNVTFPKDYHALALSGKDAKFKTLVKKVQVKKFCEDDDELATLLSCADVKVLQEKVEETLTNEVKQFSEILLKQALLEYIDSAIDVTVPESLLEKELNFLSSQPDIKKDVEALRKSKK